VGLGLSIKSLCCFLARPLHPSLPARQIASPGLVPNYRKPVKVCLERTGFRCRRSAYDVACATHSKSSLSLKRNASSRAPALRSRSKSQEGSRCLPVTALVPKSAFRWGRYFSLAKLRRGLNREKTT